MDTYAALLVNGPDFDWYRSMDSIEEVRALFQKIDFEVWAGRVYLQGGWQQVDTAKRHESYRRSEV